MSRVPFTGFASEPPELTARLVDAARSVVDSHHYVLGSQVEAFESRWASACGVSECIGVANGLDAIEIILRSMGIGAGQEVITSPMTAVATILGIIRAGATPVLADIDPDTALLDPASVQRCITEKTAAVLLVHLYGQVRNMRAWGDICDAAGIALIEDCAQSHTASEAGTVSGAFGVAGAFSFYPTKNLGALGDAGAIVTASTELAQQARQLRNYGQSNRYEHPLIGLNSRLDEMQAAILNARLDYLPEFTARRREVARRYRESISNPHVTLLAPEMTPEQHVYHLFVITTPHREALMAHLDSRGVDSLIHYPISAHRHESLDWLRTDPNGLKNAEKHADTCLSLPCHPQLTDDQIQRVINAVNSFSVT